MKSVIVIGGGVIGICTALQLQQRGFAVTVVERNRPGDSTTWASCGHIALSEVVPQSKPGTLRKIPGWLLNPTGPLSIRPASLPKIFPWMLRFVGNARASRLSHISRHLSTMTARALDDYNKLLNDYKLTGLIRDKPVIEVYDSEAELAHERPYHTMRRELGFFIDEISGAEAAEMEPTLARDFVKAVVFRDWRSVVDTHRFTVAMTDAFANAGGQFVRDAVHAFQREENRIAAIQLSGGQMLSADEIVVAAGAWSTPLLASIGVNIPVASLVGYQTMVHAPDFPMQHGVIYAAGGFGVTPYESGIGIAGTIEFADLNALPNYQRAKVLVKKARRVLPGLNVEHGEERIGRRPFCPDTLPIIDRAPGLQNLLLATGHGQLGVTLGATTGMLVSQLITGEKPAIDLMPYRVDRF